MSQIIVNLINNFNVTSNLLSPQQILSYISLLNDPNVILIENFFYTSTSLVMLIRTTRHNWKKKKIPTLDYRWRLVWYNSQAVLLLKISSDDCNVQPGLKAFFRNAPKTHPRPPESATLGMRPSNLYFPT